MPEKILIAGATGYLGSHLVKEAWKQGYTVCVLVRNPAKLKPLTGYITHIIKAEVTRPETLPEVFNDIDYIISTIGITRQKDGLSYWDVDFKGNNHLLKVAMHSGVKKFIYISVFNARQLRALQGVRAKLSFVELLRETPLNYTVIEPNGFFSDIRSYLNMARHSLVWLLGKGDYQINPIHGTDLARVCLQHLHTYQRVVPVGGPQVFTHNEIARLAFRALGKKPRLIHIPLKIVRGALWLLRHLTSEATYQPVAFFTSVLTTHMVAPTHGNHSLYQYFRKEVEAKDKKEQT
ncbi:MAG: SDR family oxidoreductase [Bacteroidales bacterium]|nr:SDR family oxidoreductase [Bacteroidales bacterium]